MVLIDWIVLGLFFAGLFGIIWWVFKLKARDTADYFLAGRDVGWFAIGASIFASNIGSEHLVGLAGAGFASGMAFAHFEFQAWCIVILAWVFVPFYRRSKVFTMPEFLERRYNSGARNFLSIISLIGYVLTKVSVTVYAGGKVLETVMGINFWTGAIIVVVITGLYTVIGGMKSVMYTSVLQTPVLILGSLIILIVGLNKIGGWENLHEICGSARWTLYRPISDPEYPWTGMIFGAPIIGLWYWCTDQYIVQRTLSARNEKIARKGSIFGAYLKLLPVFIFLVPGMIAFALNEKGLLDVGTKDSAFPLMVTKLLPVGIRGLVIGGLLAALMSSLGSLFNSCATLFTVDFYKKYKPDSSEKHYVRIGRIATIVVVVLGIAWIPVMRLIGEHLYDYLQRVQSLIAPAICAVFFLGIFSKRITPMAGLTSLVTGSVLGMFRLVLNILEGAGILTEGNFLYPIFDINWLHYCIFLFIFCIVLMVIVSLFTKKPTDEQLNGITYRSVSEKDKEETRASWNKWDIINSIIIVGIVVLCYIYFIG